MQTDKTMTELEIDMNQRIGEWELIQESSVPLKPLFGPGYTGIRNLGNSCYLNSVVQVLFSIPDFQRKWVVPFPHYSPLGSPPPTPQLLVSSLQVDPSFSCPQYLCVLAQPQFLLHCGWCAVRGASYRTAPLSPSHTQTPLTQQDTKSQGSPWPPDWLKSEQVVFILGQWHRMST